MIKSFQMAFCVYSKSAYLIALSYCIAIRFEELFSRRFENDLNMNVWGKSLGTWQASKNVVVNTIDHSVITWVES